MSRTTLAVASLTGVLACSMLAACDSDDAPYAAPGSSQSADPGEAAKPQRVKIVTNATGRNVPVDRLVTVTADHGTLQDVSVTSAQGDLTGTIGGNGAWAAQSRL